MAHVHRDLTVSGLGLWVPGTPRPQGSLKIVTARNGRAFAKNSETTLSHRNHVVWCLSQEWDGAPIQGAVRLLCRFDFARPKGHLGTGRNAGEVKPSAPAHHTTMPDLDKLLRLVGDALVVAGVLEDDSLIVELAGAKRWAGRKGPGTRIEVQEEW